MRLRPVALLIVPLLAACSTQVVERAADGPVPISSEEPGTGTMSTGGAIVGSSDAMGVAPMLSVERFLQAVNAEDLEAMGRIFGTAKGPAQGEPLQLERELALIARILRHDDYRVVSDRRAFGRVNLTHRVGVDLTIDGQRIPDVAFMVVQSGQGRWYVECIDLEKVTSGSGQDCRGWP